MPRVLAPVAAPVREILSGTRDGRSQVAAAIARPPGAPGWFVPGDAIWTVHGSVATFVGGIRALLLQALHPLALAGVQQHSTYRDDPFGRLQRTGAFIAATTFGSVELAEQTVAAVTAMHRKVRGSAPDGRSYSAQDPRLLLWVHVTLTDSMLASYQAFGRDGRIDADAYVADMAVVGRAMGVVDPPTTADELAAALAGFGPDLHSDEASAATAAFVLHPPLPLALRPGYAVLAAGAMDLLPPQYRAMLGRRPRSDAGSAAVRGATAGLLALLRAALVESPAKAAGERRLGPVGGRG